MLTLCRVSRTVPCLLFQSLCDRCVFGFQCPKIVRDFLSYVVKQWMTHLCFCLCPLPLLFPGPHFVAVNNKNEIVVTDFHNHSVKVWFVANICFKFFIVLNLLHVLWINGLQERHLYLNQFKPWKTSPVVSLFKKQKQKPLGGFK